MTVQALGQAEREAGVKLTAVRKLIEQEKIKKQTEVEVEAISDLRRAEVEQGTARCQAEARLLGAEAEMKARELEAQGQQALEMVQVHVAREQVRIKEMEVEIERQALENKQNFDRAAIDFEKAKLQIEANKKVQIANARAIGESLSHADFKVYGDPTTMGNMISNLGKGLGVGALADGLLLSAPDGVKQAVAQVGEMIASVAGQASYSTANGGFNGGAAKTNDGTRPGTVEQNGGAKVVVETKAKSDEVA